MKTLLIDTDMMIFRAAAACEKATNWAEEGYDDLWTLHVDLNEAKMSFGNIMRGIVTEVSKTHEIDQVRYALSDAQNYRKALCATYKANRTQRKPMALAPLREWVIEHHGAISEPTLEADDLLGIWQTSEKDTIIVSGDKDMLTIPGLHYNHLTKVLTKQSKEDAYYTFMKQVLMGDATDGYAGCAGYGPKTAEKLLAKHEPTDYWEAILDAYISHKKVEYTIDDALLQARLARILQASDWDAEKKEIILWTP